VYSLRLVMLHLIQGYARHNGHADLLREGIDGVVGVWRSATHPPVAPVSAITPGLRVYL
jgi:hypothetical protein